MMIKTKLLAVVLFAGLAIGAFRPAGGADVPGTQPSRPYRLIWRMVVGSDPQESVFVIVSPDGYPSVSTFAKLQWNIEHVVTSPATLNWEPSDVRIGPEPLDNATEVESLKSFCKYHNITFVTIPAG